MAPRPKRSSQLQNPLVEHVDKAVFGVLVLLLGYAVYGAITHPTYEKRPEQLKSMAESKLAAINNATPDEEFVGQFPVENFAAKVRSANQPIQPAEFAINTPFYVDRTAVLGDKRGMPELLPAVELNARFVRMSIATIDPNAQKPQVVSADPTSSTAENPRSRGAASTYRNISTLSGAEDGSPGVRAPSGSVPKGKMAIVVVGRIPAQAQLAKYHEAFRQSRFSDQDRDIPAYVTFLLERADVTDDPENPDWQGVVDNQSLVVANLLEMREWAGEAPEIVDKKYVRPLQLDPMTGRWMNFTSPLPPRLLEDWSSEATCRTIKKIDPEDETQLTSARGQAEAQPNVPLVPMGNPFDNPFQGGTPLPQSGGQRSSDGTPDMAGSRPRTKEDDVHDILLRFFDFKVEPNRRYQYRVKLVLENPNFNLPERYLKDPAVAKQQFLFSPNSDPTPAVTVAGYSEVLAGKVLPPKGFNEASASFIIRKRDSETGAIIAYEFPGVERGTLLNFDVVKKEMKGGETIGALMPNPATNQVSYADHVQFTSNELLLDVRGGDPLPGRKKPAVEPCGVLVMDENGWLQVRGEIVESADIYGEELERLAMLKESMKPPAAEETVPGSEGLGGEVGAP